MKTISFIGSDKNAGKTTAMNFVASKTNEAICLSSIGLNGEVVDNLTGTSKPTIEIKKDDYFITAVDHLKNHNGFYSIISLLSPPKYFKNFIFGKANCDFNLILEGPNEKENWVHAKEIVKKHLKNGILFIDGSIDRQFVAHPEISDSFYFCLLCSDRDDQRKKAKSLLAPLGFQSTSKKKRQILEKIQARSIVLSNDSKPIYLGTEIPFLDNQLIETLKENPKATLYLKGALTTALYKKIAGLNIDEIILDNFTLYQSEHDYRLNLTLLHSIDIHKIFVKEETPIDFEVPANIPISNIFKENIYELRN